MTKSNPSSVVHYTSINTLFAILSDALKRADGYFVMHMSNMFMMNDVAEGDYILKRFFSDSGLKKEIRSKWDEFVSDNIPCILSTMRTNQKSQFGMLPMWNMYGDNFRGCFIRFDWKRLRDYCAANNLLFKPIDYINVEGVNKSIAKLNRQSVSLEDLMKVSAFTKHTRWEHEGEWRIMAISKGQDIKIKSTPRGLVQYHEQPFPLSLIEEICIGPLTDTTITLPSLKRILSNLSQIEGANLDDKVTLSKIPIR